MRITADRTKKVNRNIMVFIDGDKLNKKYVFSRICRRNVALEICSVAVWNTFSFWKIWSLISPRYLIQICSVITIGIWISNWPISDIHNLFLKKHHELRGMMSVLEKRGKIAFICAISIHWKSHLSYLQKNAERIIHTLMFLAHINSANGFKTEPN